MDTCVHDEVSALKSTYTKELEESIQFDDDDNPSKKLYQIKLNLGPLGNFEKVEDNPFMDMVATTVITYYQDHPNRHPEIMFDGYENITPEEQHFLCEYLKQSPLDADYNITVFDICYKIQNHLGDFADQKFIEQKVKILEKEKLAQQLLEERKEKERIFMEKRRNADIALREENKRMRDQLKSRSISLGDASTVNENIFEAVDDIQKASPTACPCIDSQFCKPTIPFDVEFDSGNVMVDQIVKQKPDHHLNVYSGFFGKSSNRVIVYKWTVFIDPNSRDTTRVSKFIAAVKALEQEKFLLLKFQHPHLVPFKGLKSIRNGNGCISLYLMYDFISGLFLVRYYLGNRISVNESMLRHITEGVLKAFEYLHGKDVIHRDLRPSSICCDPSEIIKVSDYSLKRRCIEAVANYYDKEVPRTYAVIPGKNKKSDDLYRLGLILQQVFNSGKGPQAFSKQTGKMAEKFSNFLSCCLESPREGERWSADELLSHKYITDHDYSAAAYGMDENGMPFIPESLKSDSRLYKDYDCLYKLGMGGFGSVYKVQSKVDSNFYALKIIKLIEEDIKQSREMIQEVKVLSSLNHENVVRYYTSWKETLSEMLIVTPIEESVTPNDRTKISRKVTIEDCTTNDSLTNKYCAGNTTEDDSFVEFEKGSFEDETEVSESVNRTVKKAELRFAYLYIQMEFCEKMTLRHTIDGKKLLTDDCRMFRLLREIGNGLNYIHLKGLIHRDLKPGNIFIDSSDHVKIGDFGLATGITERALPRSDSSPNTKGQHSVYLTGKVGTTYYIAPEMKTGDVQVKYTNKVDIYSLGIIFFEMVYPLETVMERAQVLNDLKLDPPLYPNDYTAKVDVTKEKIVRMLLHPDPSKRPTTRELLDSELLPPLPAEQRKFMVMIKEAMEKDGSARYQDMMQLLFSKGANPGLEATFEAVNNHKSNLEQLRCINSIYCNLVKIFQKHGGIWISTPFFTPKDSGYADLSKTADFLTKDGDLVTSQYDLRYPFARFLAKNDIKKLKRFYIDKIYRSVKTPSVHPRESYECAFDIVDNEIHLLESTIRLFLVAQEILLDVCGLAVDDVVIKLSHTDFVRVMLLQADIDVKYHPKIFSLLNDLQRKVFGFDENSFLDCVREVTHGAFDLATLKVLLAMEGTVEEVIASITSKSLIPKEYEELFRKVSRQLQDLVRFSKDMGVKFAFSLQPLMIADKVLYHGLAFQFQTVKVSRKIPYTVLAKGGSYDHLIASHKKKTYIKSSQTDDTCAVGISLSLTSLRNALEKYKPKMFLKGTLNNDVLVCSVRDRQMDTRMKLVRSLQEAGLSVDHCFMENINEASPFYSNNKYFLCIQPGEKFLVRIVESEDTPPKVTEKYFTTTEEVEEYFKKISRPYSAELSIYTSARKETNKSAKLPPNKYELSIEYFCRKPLKDKEERIKQKITRDIEAYITSEYGSWSNPGAVEVMAMDLDKNFVLSLGVLDLTSTQKDFNDSFAELKASCRITDIKEYFEKINKFCVKNIFPRKKLDKSVCILAYSISSEFLRRLY